MFAAAEAKSAGRGGVAAVARITGIARSTIIRGLAEIIAGSVDNPAAAVPATRVRRAGGGRKKLTQTDPTLLADLQELVAAATRGDPQAPLLWTSRSLRNLAAALQAMGHRISHHAVADLLRELNYSLQSQDTRRSPQPRPRCAICLYQCKSCGGISRRRAGHLRRYQEKGTGRRLQERRPRTAPQRRTRTGARS